MLISIYTYRLTQPPNVGLLLPDTHVRFQLYEDDDGHPQVMGYHTGENSNYGDRLRLVQATAVGEHFEVAVNDELTIYCYPDESGHPLQTNTAFAADTGIDPHTILVRPIEENGQEIMPPVYPNPADEQVELIVHDNHNPKEPHSNSFKG